MVFSKIEFLKAINRNLKNCMKASGCSFQQMFILIIIIYTKQLHVCSDRHTCTCVSTVPCTEAQKRQEWMVVHVCYHVHNINPISNFEYGLLACLVKENCSLLTQFPYCIFHFEFILSFFILQGAKFGVGESNKIK